jgi:hypothetical protein
MQPRPQGKAAHLLGQASRTPPAVTQRFTHKKWIQWIYRAAPVIAPVAVYFSDKVTHANVPAPVSGSVSFVALFFCLATPFAIYIWIDFFVQYRRSCRAAPPKDEATVEELPYWHLGRESGRSAPAVT